MIPFNCRSFLKLGVVEAMKGTYIGFLIIDYKRISAYSIDSE